MTIDPIERLNLTMCAGALAAPSHSPMSGIGLPGLASCQRIKIIRQKPNNRKHSEVSPYWSPITL